MPLEEERRGEAANTGLLLAGLSFAVLVLRLLGGPHMAPPSG